MSATKGFAVRLADRYGVAVATQLTLIPVRYTWAAVGGPEAAELTVEGADDSYEQVFGMLGGRLTILAPDGTPVWWGLVHEATVTAGGVEYGLSLARMANRIAVLYSVETEDGALAAQTAWAEDAGSVAQYGRKELLYSLGTASPEQAQAALGTLLARMAQPRMTVQSARNDGSGATLLCVGYWETLKWRYFAQDAGRVVHLGENETEQLLGWGFTNSQFVGFDDRARRIAQLGAALTGLREGDRITVTGSTSNNGSFTVAEKASVDKPVTYTGEAIYFDPINDMHDAAERLDQLRAGEMIRIQDAANAGFWFLKSVSPDHATLHPETIVSEAASVVTLTQGNSICVAEPLTLERPQPGVKYITIAAHGVKVAQSFALEVYAAPWPVGEVVVNLRRIGSPSDAVKVELCADGGGVPGAVLDAATTAGAILPAKQLAPIAFTLNRTAQLAFGVTYWLVVSRTGAISHQHYYEVGVDADAGYLTGILRLWTGSAWTTRTAPASLNFQVYGHRETTAQIADAVLAVGGYLTGVRIRKASGVFTRHSRPGRSTAAAEVEKLLAAGIASGRRLLATVLPDGNVIVDEAPQEALAELRLRGGKIVNRFGHDLAAGHLPVGEWVRFAGPHASPLAAAYPVQVERAEYDVAAGVITPEFAASASVWDFGAIEQG